MGRPLTTCLIQEGSAVQREKEIRNQFVLSEKCPQAISQFHRTYFRQGEPRRFVGI